MEASGEYAGINLTESTICGTFDMKKKAKLNLKKLTAAFFQLGSGREPVREWLLQLEAADRKLIGDDIRTAEFGWPIGMPICRSIAGRTGLWEVRTNLPNKRIARVLFFVKGKRMVLLHGLIKKTQKTPKQDLDLAEKRMKAVV